jgi:hypothetical protein
MLTSSIELRRYHDRRSISAVERNLADYAIAPRKEIVLEVI